MNENSIGELEILINCSTPTEFWSFFEIMKLTTKTVVLTERDKNPASKEYLGTFLRVTQELGLEVSIK